MPDLNVIPKPDWSDVIDLPYRYHDRKNTTNHRKAGGVLDIVVSVTSTNSGQNLNLGLDKTSQKKMIENYKTHGVSDFYFMDSPY